MPFIIIKETKDQNSPNQYYEILFSQNQYIFNFLHPIINELLQSAFIIGLEQNKRLEYLPIETKNDISSVKSDSNENIFVNKTIKMSFEEYKSDKPEIILKTISSSINKLLLECMTKNYENI